jgi:hypothetical protein
MTNDTKKPSFLNRIWNAFADLFPGEREPLLDNVKPPTPADSECRGAEHVCAKLRERP